MSEQLKQQQLYDVSEANTKNLIWVDVYVSGTEGSAGVYASRRMTKAQLIAFLNSNLTVAWSVITGKPTTLTGYGLGGGTLNRLAKFTPDGNAIGDSQIIDDGTGIGVGTAIQSDKKVVIAETRDDSVGLLVTNTGGGTTYTQGINGVAIGTSTSDRIGTRGTSSGSTVKNVGVYGESAGNATGQSIGVYGLANLSQTSNVAGYFEASSTTAGVTYGSFNTAEGSTNINYGSFDQATGNATGKTIGTYGRAVSSQVENIGGKFESTAVGAGTAYGLQVTDGTQAVGKYLKSITSDGKTNWSYITPTVQTVTSSATVTPVSTNDLVTITAQATGLTLANPTGTFAEGQSLMIRIKDNGTAQTIAFGTNYRAIGITLPTTTVINKTLYLGIIYNSTDGKWDVLGLNQQA